MELDRKISIGNIWTIAMVGVGLVAGWVQFGNNIESNAKDIRLVELRVSALESNLPSNTATKMPLDNTAGKCILLSML